MIDRLTRRPYFSWWKASTGCVLRVQTSRRSRIYTSMFCDNRFTTLLTVDSLWPRNPIQSLDRCGGAPLPSLRKNTEQERAWVQIG
jgi:hypothetical protein